MIPKLAFSFLWSDSESDFLQQILSIHLKRFRHEFYSSKISTYISFPMEGLDMEPYLHKGELLPENHAWCTFCAFIAASIMSSSRFLQFFFLCFLLNLYFFLITWDCCNVLYCLFILSSAACFSFSLNSIFCFHSWFMLSSVSTSYCLKFV